jgi:two-component system chemotaxis response regulator CheY
VGVARWNPSRDNGAVLRLKILVVDDSLDVRDTTAEILAMEGHELTVASDGLDALRCVDAGLVPDVVIVDLFMPRMDGATFLRSLGDRLASKPRVVVATGVRSPHLQRLVGADAVLFKPYLPRDLLRAVTGRVTSEPSPSRSGS